MHDGSSLIFAEIAHPVDSIEVVPLIEVDLPTIIIGLAEMVSDKAREILIEIEVCHHSHTYAGTRTEIIFPEILGADSTRLDVHLQR